ncbi:pseudouridine synthase [Akkermansiaceae bacterium]|nr:pseudouridine synthase [Akkermansiaceae bacterium]MDB4041252.1 pseudouridine synthase [Akkermansiaceae bacterium]MDB4276335.1 pseudouridine synthase [Akkermansiaceae bacterium]MDB4320991.1 pseudouridine synthase [Akkermansiaceae bacterium]MDB4334211.1 pseudouridine synthase [Akkermansiaceae bacterium]
MSLHPAAPARVEARGRGGDSGVLGKLFHKQQGALPDKKRKDDFKIGFFTSDKFPSRVPLDILYQDHVIVAVDKPAGQMVIPADKPQEGDEVTMKILRDQIGKRVHPIHRLDRPTSGVLIFATDPEVARELHFAFEQHEVEKVYWAVIVGRPLADEWTCEEPIQKKEGAPHRSARTDFKVLQPIKGNLTLIEAFPKTGRFHQIRRHLLHVGHPIVGDYRYAGVERCDYLGELLGTESRMLLQAKSLRLRHPVTGEELLIEAPLDEAIAKCL